MRRLLFFLSCVAVPSFAAPECPKEDWEWSLFRSGLIGQIQIYQGGVSVTQKEKETLKCLQGANERVKKCMAPLVRYLEQTNGQVEDADLNLGRNISVDDYAARYRELLEPPPELLDRKFTQNILPWTDSSLTEVGRSIRLWNEDRKQNGLAPVLFVKYKSALPSLDAYGRNERLLFYIPSSGRAGTDRFVQFTPGGAVVSTVAVVKDGSGKAKSYFKDNYLQQGEMFPFIARMQDKNAVDKFREDAQHIPKDKTHFSYAKGNVTGSAACVSCHSKGGPLPIRPEEEVSSSDQQSLDAINRVIQSYGRTLSEHEIDFEGVLPPFGDFTQVEPAPLNRFCFEGYLNRRTANLPKGAQEQARSNLTKKLTSAMNCVECHDGKEQAFLYPPFSSNDVAGIMALVLRGKMPPDNNLTEEEREILWMCMQNAYWGRVKRSNALMDYSAVLKFLAKDPCKKEEKPTLPRTTTPKNDERSMPEHEK